MIYGGILIAIGVIFDQILKIIVRLNMDMQEEHVVIKNFFSFTYIENDGAAWGSFSGGRIVLILFTIVALVVFAFFFKDIDLKKKKLYSYGTILMISGTLGNFIDRIIFGSVTDYLDFLIFGYDFPIFNLADCFLVVGVGIFLLDAIITGTQMIKTKKEEKDEGSNNNQE